MPGLKGLERIAGSFRTQGKKMPVLFTSHGSPFDIVKPREERPLWNKLFELGQNLQHHFEINAALIVSAHWCTKGTFVNCSYKQRQIYDFYGFPETYYRVIYTAKGSPETAGQLSSLVPGIVPTTDWGLDHGSWPMLMHLFPGGDVPVFQMSIDYHAKPEHHIGLGRQLRALRRKGVLIIGSGALIHNLSLAYQKIAAKDLSPYGWEAEYDEWLGRQILSRNTTGLINYENSHPLGKLASPTPDHFVPVLYSLGLMEPNDELSFIYEAAPSIPAFSERGFLISQ